MARLIKAFIFNLLAMRSKILFTALLLATGFVSSIASSVEAVIRLPESCRMGGCSRSTIESKEALRSNNLGTLYSVTSTIEQYPPDPQSSYYSSEDQYLADQDYERFVDFYGTDYISNTGQFYVFCSKAIPSVLFESEDTYYVNRLAIFESPYGYNRHAYQEYLATCHNLAGPDYFSLNVYSLLLEEGYTDEYIAQSNQFTTDNPLDVMRLTEQDR